MLVRLASTILILGLLLPPVHAERVVHEHHHGHDASADPQSAPSESHHDGDNDCHDVHLCACSCLTALPPAAGCACPLVARTEGRVDERALPERDGHAALPYRPPRV